MRPKSKNLCKGSKESAHKNYRHLSSHPIPPSKETKETQHLAQSTLTESMQKERSTPLTMPRSHHLINGAPESPSQGAQEQAARRSPQPQQPFIDSLRDRKPMPTTSMETEFIEAMYADESNATDRNSYTSPRNTDDARLNSSDSEDYGADSFEDNSDDADGGDFDDLDAYEHDDFMSSQEASLFKLRRDHVEFEENLRLLQQQLQNQGSMLPLFSDENVTEYENMAHCDVYSDSVDQPASPIEGSNGSLEIQADSKQEDPQSHANQLMKTKQAQCELCNDPESKLCLCKYGQFWRHRIVEALSTAAAAIALFHQRFLLASHDSGYVPLTETYMPYQEFLPLRHRPNQPPYSDTEHYPGTHLEGHEYPSRPAFGAALIARHFSSTRHATSLNSVEPPNLTEAAHLRYPLHPDSPYTFRRWTSEFLEPVGEFQEFQSAEGNSRQVLLHVWPPSDLDTPLLQKLEACCRDFQENDIVRGHSGDGFINGWRPSWKDPNQTGVLRFGHWRVRAPPEQSTDLFAPFQTPLTLAAAGGSILGPVLNMSHSHHHPSMKDGNGHHNRQHNTRNHHGPHCMHHHSDPSYGHDQDVHQDAKSVPTNDPHQQQQQQQQQQHLHHHHHHHHHHEHTLDTHLGSPTQGRLLRLVRALQMVEKAIIARHLKYLFPTLYEKYHGLQFGTPRLFDAVATVALAMDVSPRLHHDKAHTKHGFCWIVACGDFVGGDLCIPELGKRVVMRPGTVVAIRSTVVAYYIERYAKNTSMYTMYAYTADNCWPPPE